MLNRSGAGKDMSVAWTDIGYPDSLQASVRDLWLKKDLGRLKGSYSASVPSHAVVLVTIKP